MGDEHVCDQIRCSVKDLNETRQAPLQKLSISHPCLGILGESPLHKTDLPGKNSVLRSNAESYLHLVTLSCKLTVGKKHAESQGATLEHKLTVWKIIECFASRILINYQIIIVQIPFISYISVSLYIGHLHI